MGNIGHFISSKPMIFDHEKNTLLPEKGNDGPKKLIDLNVMKKGVKIASVMDTGIHPSHMSTRFNGQSSSPNRDGRYQSSVLGTNDSPRRDQQKAQTSKSPARGKQTNKAKGSRKADEEEEFLRAEEERQSKEEKRRQKDDKLNERDKKRQLEKEIEEHREQLKGEPDKKKEEYIEGKLRMADVQGLPDEVDEILGSLGSMNFGVQDLDVLIELSKQLKNKRIKLFPDTSYVFSLQNAGLSNDQI